MNRRAFLAAFAALFVPQKQHSVINFSSGRLGRLSLQIQDIAIQTQLGQRAANHLALAGQLRAIKEAADRLA